MKVSDGILKVTDPSNFGLNRVFERNLSCNNLWAAFEIFGSQVSLNIVQATTADELNVKSYGQRGLITGKIDLGLGIT